MYFYIISENVTVIEKPPVTKNPHCCQVLIC